MTGNRQEQALQAQADLLATVFESSPNILMLVDSEGRVEKINRAGSDVAGSPKEKLIGLLGGEVFQCINSFDGLGCGRNPECDDCPVRTRVTQSLEEDVKILNEEGSLTVRKEAGETPMDFLISTVPVKIANETKVLVTIVDITDRKRAEEALRRSELQNRTILRTALDGFWLVDPENGRILDVNDAYCQMSGYTRAEILQMTIDEFDVAESFEDVHEHNQKVLSLGEDRFESMHKRKDGSIFEVEVSVQSLRDDGGRNFAFIHDVTARKQAEQALQKSEEQYRLLFDEMLSGFALHEIICDEHGKPVDYRFLAVNESFEHLTGLKADDIIGNTVMEILPEIEPFWIDRYGKVALEGATVQFDGFNAGIGKHYEARAFCPEPGKFAVMFHDVTERKKVEERLNELVERLGLATRAARMGIWDWDIQKNELIWDDQMYELYGVRREDFSGAYEAWLAGIHPDDREASDEISRRARIGEIEYDTQFRVVWPDGSIRYIKALGQVVHDGEGNPLRMIGVNYDITEGKLAEDELQQSEENLEITLQSIGDAVIATDLSGQVIRMNPAAEKLTGWEFGEAKNRALGEVFRIVNANTRKKVADPVKKVLGNGKVVGLANHTVLLSRDGQEYQIADSAAPIRDKDGRLQGVILTFSDVTEKYKAEEALRNSEGNLKKAQHIAKVGSWIWNIKTNHLEWSDGMFSVFGIDKQNFSDSLNDVISTFIHPDDRARVEEANQSVAREGKPVPVEYRVIRPDGSVRTVWAEAGELIRDEHGNPAVLTGIVQDITERKQYEEKLKMLLQEKEILLAEVHHRVKNNLQIIVSLLGLQAREIGDERVRVAFEESRNRIKSMALVHEQLYRSREYAKIEFESYVDQLASTLFNMYQVEPERVRMEIDADDVYLNLENAIPCGLLLNELITNSLKYAFPNGRTGKIWITLVPEESNLILTVGDDGIGIPAKFDFGASQSLGLQLVHLLTVHDLQGKITLERKNGTQFRIEFPVQPGKGG